ncbi:MULTISPECIES: MFS transporter [Gordonia]|uniref:MFS transporter n=2 Tax=Gordoniaceae TaxID=85026 RepID=UPI0004B2F8A0|nr:MULTISPECIES: MFS transporter [Gordonia]MDH3008750.1 MFS transporter [Gordonia alkanivorans]MDH3012635.1 MFS transporter [Gordonia alkanivorans]MDH3017681.1 MFS transporter [Gordonia alkanivorans]MDH3022031.1 MFS transporter [Gordonia alkanivorans]MDH3043051.1 MFS transporter [Gordonia alkanivorans]
MATEQGNRPLAEYLAVGAAIGGVVAYSLLQAMLVPVLPSLREKFGVTTSDVAWILTGFLLSSAVSTPVVGRLGDIRGLKRMYLFALACLAAGALIAACAPTLAVSVAGRILQGVGGGIIPLAYGILRAILPSHRLPAMIGVVGGVAGMGNATGTVLAGPILQYLGYAWLFLIPALLCVISGIVVAIVVPSIRAKSDTKINVAAAVLLAGWLSTALIVLGQGSSWGWTSRTTILAAVLSVVAFAAWIVSELRSRHALIDVRLMVSTRAVAASHTISLLIGFVLFGVFALLPAYLQDSGGGFGLSSASVGLYMVALSLGMFVVGFVAGRLIRRLRSRAMVALGSAVVASVLLTLALAEHGSSVRWALTLVMGLGFGCCFPAISTVVVMSVDPGDTAQASGVNANLRTIGGAVGTVAVTGILTMAASVGTRTGFAVGFAVLAAVAIVASVCAATLLPRRPRRRSTEQPLIRAGHPAAVGLTPSTTRPVSEEPGDEEPHRSSRSGGVRRLRSDEEDYADDVRPEGT